jgi:hypothetical protein
MKIKKSLLALSVFIFLVGINFVSAQDTLSDLLNSFDESMVILAAVFIISFSILFFALTKSLFRDNIPIAGVIAGAIAFLTTWGINRTGFDFGGFFIDFGISENLLMTILPLVIIAGIIFVIIKLKSMSLFIFGGLLIVLSFFVYAKALLVVVGLILLGIGFYLTSRKGKDGKGKSEWEKARR